MGWRHLQCQHVHQRQTPGGRDAAVHGKTWIFERGRVMFHPTRTNSGVDNGWFGC